MPRRVAIVTESFLPQINGVTNSVIRILETFKQREIDAVVIAPTATSSHHLGFEVVTTPYVPLMQFPVGVPSPWVSRALDSFEPDLVHVAAPFLLGAQALAWANRNSVPSVAIYQTDVAGYLNRYNLKFAKSGMERLTSAIHQNASLNLAPTTDGAKYLESIGVDNVAVWGRGVDLDLFTPKNKLTPETTEIRNRLLGDNRIVVGFVGRLAPEKQVHRMLELLEIPNLSFVVVGDGPERENLEKIFDGRVHFTGALTGLDLAYHYAAMDVFVHFGTEETYGQTIQEAQATGLCVIAPDRQGPKNLIQHGVSGLLVDPLEPNGYQMALRRAINEELLSGLQNGAVAAVSNKSWAKNNAELLTHYRKTMLQHQTRRALRLELV